MGSSLFFHIKLVPILKILFVELEWLKTLKDSFEEDSPIVVSSHILFTNSHFSFILYLPILEVSYV